MNRICCEFYEMRADFAPRDVSEEYFNELGVSCFVYRKVDQYKRLLLNKMCSIRD